VRDPVRDSFGGFYRALFERVRERNPNTVVTEYSWDATSCDPCPEPALNASELTLLGADVLGGNMYSFVLTRLHYRYEKEDLDNDLVFRAAPPIVGGRGMPGPQGQLEEQEAAVLGSTNNFQGRYVILHKWDGPIQCQQPRRGNWGGPPGGQPNQTRAAAGGPSAAPTPAARVSLGALVAEPVESIALRPGDPDPEPAPEPQTPPPATGTGEGGCAGCTVGGASGLGGGFAALLVLAALRPGRRRRG